MCRHYGGPQVQTQQHILETQQTIFGTQHNIIETQHNFIETQHNIWETQHKIFSKFMQNLCYYTTYKRIITQPLTFYAPCKIPPFLVAILLSQNVLCQLWNWVKISLQILSFLWRKVELDTVSASETDTGATKCLSFKDYAARKSDERSTHF